MNIRKIFPISWFAVTNLATTSPKSALVRYGLSYRKSNNKQHNSSSSSLFRDLHLKYKFLRTAGITLAFFPFFGAKNDDETPEDKLIMTIKRSVLCIQKEEYGKAEQMLHLALRMAQDIKSKDGITYVYDLLANLAMEREQYAKAEKLFADVMKRLFADGYKEDDIQMLHISSKIAHISHLQGQIEKAMQGFIWTLQKIELKIKELPDNGELRELWGLTKNWYGQTLMENENYKEAKKHLLEAFNVFTEINGKINAEALTMLNNLSVACTYLDDITSARKFLDEALDIAKEMPEAAEIGMLKANLGLLYLKQGLLQQAKDACGFAWRFGKKINHGEIVDQADHCLKLINEFNK